MRKHRMMKKSNLIKELMGQPHMPTEEEQEELYEVNMDQEYPIRKQKPVDEEEITDAWIYSLSCGDGWDVTLRDDGTLTVEQRDAI